ncbi:hypothetical protein MTO96_013309 [Rhipicephalus appendiculatus]
MRIAPSLPELCSAGKARSAKPIREKRFTKQSAPACDGGWGGGREVASRVTGKTTRARAPAIQFQMNYSSLGTEPADRPQLRGRRRGPSSLRGAPGASLSRRRPVKLRSVGSRRGD